MVLSGKELLSRQGLPLLLQAVRVLPSQVPGVIPGYGHGVMSLNALGPSGQDFDHVTPLPAYGSCTWRTVCPEFYLENVDSAYN